MSGRRAASTLVIAVAVALGVLLGSGGFTFLYAEGHSYLGDDPGACINCHVMQEDYDDWISSSHSSVAVCNDCHVPQGNMVAKYWSKAIDGFNHSLAFTTGRFPEHIVITPAGRGITESTCRGCHARITHAIDTGASGAEHLECTRCHSSVGHGP